MVKVLLSGRDYQAERIEAGGSKSTFIETKKLWYNRVARNVTMTRKFLKNQAESARIRKKIDDYNKYQWLVFIPLWGVTIAQMIFPARTLPMPEIYILFLDVAAFLFSVIAFIAIRLRVGKLRYALAQLEKTDYIPKHSQPPQRKR